MADKKLPTIPSLSTDIQSLIKTIQSPQGAPGDPQFPSPQLQQPNLAPVPQQEDPEEMPLGKRIARAIALIGAGISENPQMVPTLLDQFSKEDRAAKVEANQRFQNEFARTQALNQQKLTEFGLQKEQVKDAEARKDKKRERTIQDIELKRGERGFLADEAQREDARLTNQLQREAARAAIKKNNLEMAQLDPAKVAEREHLGRVNQALELFENDLRLQQQNALSVIESKEQQVNLAGQRLVPEAETNRLRAELSRFIQGERLERAVTILQNSPPELKALTAEYLAMVSGEDVPGQRLAAVARQMLSAGATPDTIAFFVETASEQLSTQTGIPAPALDTLQADLMAGEKGAFDVIGRGFRALGLTFTEEQRALAKKERTEGRAKRKRLRAKR